MGPKNCLFFGNSGGDYAVDTYGEPDVFTAGDAINNNIAGASGNLDGDPQFVNLGIRNFHLSNLSPCVDKGTDENAPSYDFENNARPHDVPGRGNESPAVVYDIGAYENQDTGVYTPTHTPTPVNTPTPTATIVRSTSVKTWEVYE